MGKIGFLKEWRKTKGRFIRPKFRLFIGRWSREPNLPVWRHGNIINLGNYKERDNEWNYSILVSSRWTEEGRKKHPFLSKFFKPTYMLPNWLSFYFFNRDIGWKTREEEYDFRYENPAHITLVIFNMSISITAYIPQANEDDWTCEDDYWESLLTYNYFNGDLKKTNDVMKWWGTPGEEDFRFCFQPRFLTDEEERSNLVIIQAKVYNKLLKERNI